MTLADMGTADLIGTLLAFAFTLMVFSYILGDNPLFRLAIHIFIGVAAGYTTVIAWYNVIWPQLLLPLITGGTAGRFILLIPLVLGALLFSKLSPRLAGLGSLALAFLVGAGAAAAIGGAVLGTLFPQVSASANLFGVQELPGGAGFLSRLIEALIILVGTLTALIYFQFTARPQPNKPPQRMAIVESLAWVGQFFIALTLGALFAGVYAAALSALVERMSFLVNFLMPLITS
jgi:hypothetical protein